ncbi:hypothetical protein QVD17_27930 [Tagetes erecta]|uniref:S-protein homolog n=1 Tax=Tagetes erecta TaxID=13708 RepID=A0AAD8KA57_TARER|nr:hypothetical protein QVD17_27930 [Tagetes erecta]
MEAMGKCNVPHCIRLEATPPSSKPFVPYRVTITNRDVPKVAVGCDDLGGDVLEPGKFISWRFHMNFVDSNEYNCRFYWLDEKTLDIRYYSAFTVFDVKFEEHCGRDLLVTTRCYWYVTQGGFFFSDSNVTFPSVSWEKVHDWNKI